MTRRRLSALTLSMTTAILMLTEHGAIGSELLIELLRDDTQTPQQVAPAPKPATVIYGPAYLPQQVAPASKPAIVVYGPAFTPAGQAADGISPLKPVRP